MVKGARGLAVETEGLSVTYVTLRCGRSWDNHICAGGARTVGKIYWSCWWKILDKGKTDDCPQICLSFSPCLITLPLPLCLCIVSRFPWRTFPWCEISIPLALITYDWTLGVSPGLWDMYSPLVRFKFIQDEKQASKGPLTGSWGICRYICNAPNNKAGVTTCTGVRTSEPLKYGDQRNVSVCVSGWYLGLNEVSQCSWLMNLQQMVL